MLKIICLSSRSFDRTVRWLQVSFVYFAIFLFVCVLLLFFIIAYQSYASVTMVSLRGGAQAVTLHGATTRQNGYWSLGTAFLCVPLSRLSVLPEPLQLRAEGGHRDCKYTNSNGVLYVPLGDDVEVSFEEPASVRIEVFARNGNDFLSIASANPLASVEGCSKLEQHFVNIHTSIPGGNKVRLPLHVDIIASNSIGTVMPYHGSATVGGSVVESSAPIMNSGTAAMYLDSGGEMQLVKKTELFPGDQVRFMADGCEVSSTGFLRVEADGGRHFLNVIGSAAGPDVSLSVSRMGPERLDGKRTDLSEIMVRANWTDKLLSNALIGILGGAMSVLFLVLELVSISRGFKTKP